VAEGVLDSEQAIIAMSERSGPEFEAARERVKMELAMRVPTMSALLSGLTADSFGQGVARMAATAPASLFGAGLLPAGELEYRGLKEEWNDAWKRKDAGDSTAITQFFDEYPEYEAYLAKGKEPEERVKSFLIGQVWDGYMGLGKTNQKQATLSLGKEFADSFLNKDTRSYDALDIDTLTQWARALYKKVPSVTQNQTAMSQPAPQMKMYDQNTTAITDKFFSDRTAKFPNYYEQQQGYYALPKSEQVAYLAKTPGLKAYWDWKDAWYQNYPSYVDIFNGKVYAQVDTSGWPPSLETFVQEYALTGERMPNGAWKALEQVWIGEGKPFGNMQSWLNNTVVPAMMYQDRGAMQ